MVYTKILASNEATKGFFFLNQTQITLQSLLSSSEKYSCEAFQIHDEVGCATIKDTNYQLHSDAHGILSETSINNLNLY